MFPFMTCSLEWRTDLDDVASFTLTRLDELYGIVAFDRSPFVDEPYLPDADAGLIYTNPIPGDGATLILLDGDAVVAVDFTCGGGPADFLDHPQYGEPDVIAYGPAHR